MKKYFIPTVECSAVLMKEIMQGIPGTGPGSGAGGDGNGPDWAPKRRVFF